MTNDLGRQLRKLRIHMGMTQQDLADRLGVTKAIISSYEQGNNMPGYLKLIEMASFFHVSTDYLLGVGDEFYDERLGITGDQAEDLDGKARKLNDRHMGIGRQLGRLRNEMGLSRQELADSLKLSTVAIGKYERDVMAPAYVTLLAMAGYFKVSTEDLFGIDTGQTMDISSLSDSNKVIVKDLVRQLRK